MQDMEIFLSLAEMGGIFVGFGALIALRGHAPDDTWGVAGIGMIVLGGIEVVALALAPVAMSRFGVADHLIWASCAVAFLLLFWVVGELVERAFPARMAMRRSWPLRARWRIELVHGLLILLPMHLALIAILLGTLPHLEPALYFAALVLLLLTVATELLWMVVTGGRPSSAQDRP